MFNVTNHQGNAIKPTRTEKVNVGENVKKSKSCTLLVEI
jgi:hypothetical protein